jgi:hypothetical protein
MMDEQRKQLKYDSFHRSANNTISWMRTAEGLIAAALILRQSRPRPEGVLEMRPSEVRAVDHLLWPELMLWGLSIEDLLKCLILRHGGKLAKDGKFVGRKNHDLGGLATDAHFSLDDSEGSVIDTLSRAVKWAGRYPVATEFSKSGGWRLWTIPVDDEVVDAIIAKLKREIGNLEPNSACS